MQATPNEPKKIIVVKQGGIGDVILATPILAELKRIFPTVYLTLLIYPNAIPLVEGLPFIDKVVGYDKKVFGPRKLFRLMRGNDWAIFLDLSYRPALMAALARVPCRVGLAHKRGFWLTRALPWEEYMDHTYEPYVFADILHRSLGLNLARENLQRPYVAPATDEECVALRTQLQRAGIEPGEKYIVCSPQTAFVLKDWPMTNWRALFRLIYAAYGYKTVIFGAKKFSFAWEDETTVDFTAALSLRQAGELVKRAALLVNSCSMPEHLAAANNTPCVILVGYSEPKRWLPRHNSLAVRTALPCSPCDGYHGTNCVEAKCMQAITPTEVFTACQTMLNANYNVSARRDDHAD